MLEELEIARKKTLNIWIVTFGSILLIGFLIGFFTGMYQFIFMFLVAAIVLSSIISNKSRKEFSKLYKNNIVLTSFNKICDDVTFDMDRGFPRSVIADTHMMNMGDYYYSNDYVKGKYKNINFEMSDIKIEEESTDSEGNTTTYTIFNGQWYIFDFNKTFKANVQVCHKYFGNAKRGSLFAKKEEKYKRVQLEDIDFNKTFKVFAQNELDAFYILTPPTIEKIKNLANKVKGRLLFCFIDDKLHIGVSSNKDLFEASIFKKIDLDKEIAKTNEEISTITDFVNILSLDNDLFKR